MLPAFFLAQAVRGAAARGMPGGLWTEIIHRHVLHPAAILRLSALVAACMGKTFYSAFCFFFKHSNICLIAGGWSQVWYDDARSIKEKVQLASQMGLQGVGMWNLDCLEYGDIHFENETAAMWKALQI